LYRPFQAVLDAEIRKIAKALGLSDVRQRMPYVCGPWRFVSWPDRSVQDPANRLRQKIQAYAFAAANVKNS